MKMDSTWKLIILKIHSGGGHNAFIITVQTKVGVGGGFQFRVHIFYKCILSDYAVPCCP
jgi:hypothetical protein